MLFIGLPFLGYGCRLNNNHSLLAVPSIICPSHLSSIPFPVFPPVPPPPTLGQAAVPLAALSFLAPLSPSPLLLLPPCALPLPLLPSVLSCPCARAGTHVRLLHGPWHLCQKAGAASETETMNIDVMLSAFPMFHLCCCCSCG